MSKRWLQNLMKFSLCFNLLNIVLLNVLSVVSRTNVSVWPLSLRISMTVKYPLLISHCIFPISKLTFNKPGFCLWHLTIESNIVGTKCTIVLKAMSQSVLFYFSFSIITATQSKLTLRVFKTCHWCSFCSEQLIKIIFSALLKNHMTYSISNITYIYIYSSGYYRERERKRESYWNSLHYVHWLSFLLQ
jgi:hypothetical protein